MYQYKLIKIEENIFNDGFNNLYKIAHFEVNTITGRKLENITAKFWEDSEKEFINSNLKLLNTK